MVKTNQKIIWYSICVFFLCIKNNKITFHIQVNVSPSSKWHIHTVVFFLNNLNKYMLFKRALRNIIQNILQKFLENIRVLSNFSTTDNFLGIFQCSQYSHSSLRLTFFSSSKSQWILITKLKMELAVKYIFNEYVRSLTAWLC